MAIPDYQTIMLPLLQFLQDQQEHGIREAINHISVQFSLTEQEKEELLPSGQQQIINNRVGWARTYMKKAGLVESTRTGYVKITQRGLEVLNQNPNKIDINFLGQFPEFVEFRTIGREQSRDVNRIITEVNNEIENITPDERIESGFNSIQESLGQELLVKIRGGSHSFFETIVLNLLSGMGYGEGRVTGQTGDGGVDGFVTQDKLGLDKIFFQAKKFGEDTPVSASMIRDFVGSLEVNGITKGIFITTSRFPRDAENTISRSHKHIVLIDGIKLVRLMIDFNIGVSTQKIYKVKRIDSDFFIEE